MSENSKSERRVKIPTQGEILTALVEAAGGESIQPLAEMPVVHDKFYQAPSTRALVFTVSAAMQALGIPLERIQPTLVARPEFSDLRQRMPFEDLARIIHEELEKS